MCCGIGKAQPLLTKENSLIACILTLHHHPLLLPPHHLPSLSPLYPPTITATKELPPLDPDWYFVRSASIARRIYLNGGIGVGALAHWYGDAKSTKSRPEHHHPAARGLIRHILKNLQDNGLVEEIPKKGGRRVTSEGQKELDTM